MKAKIKAKKYLIVIMSILSVVMLIPFVILVSTSLKSMNDIQSSVFTFIPKQVVWHNFIDAMSRGNWLRYFWNTFFVTVVVVFFSLITNSLTGYAFARLRFRGRETLFVFTLIGFMIPPQVTMIPLFTVLKNFPLVGGNDILGNGGIGFVNSYYALILPYIAGSFGVFMFRQFFMNFPEALDDAARIDGLGRFKAFCLIYVPLSKPVFATLAVLKATQTWNEYTWPLVITNTDEMKTVQLALTLFKTETDIQWNLLMAATLMISLPLIILFVFAQRYFVEGIVTTGLKN